MAVWLLARGVADDADAISLLAAAEALRGEIGAPRFPPTQEALDEALRPARARTSREVFEAASTLGAAAALGETVSRVRRLVSA